MRENRERRGSLFRRDFSARSIGADPAAAGCLAPLGSGILGTRDLICHCYIQIDRARTCERRPRHPIGLLIDRELAVVREHQEKKTNVLFGADRTSSAGRACSVSFSSLPLAQNPSQHRWTRDLGTNARNG
jgi:hypothetical protein